MRPTAMRSRESRKKSWRRRSRCFFIRKSWEKWVRMVDAVQYFHFVAADVIYIYMTHWWIIVKWCVFSICLFPATACWGSKHMWLVTANISGLKHTGGLSIWERNHFGDFIWFAAIHGNFTTQPQSTMMIKMGTWETPIQGVLLGYEATSHVNMHSLYDDIRCNLNCLADARLLNMEVKPESWGYP